MVDELSGWTRALSDAGSFDAEQRQLGRLWTFLGLATDIPGSDDWFCATLGARSVFVQRFGSQLRAFENVCAHRFYPLRTEKKGSGPIRCGFHHWQYNADGRAVGIPKCLEMYGKTPRELDARLKPIELARCGNLIFGRYPSSSHKESLEEYLGEGFSILQSMWSSGSAARCLETKIAANWRFGYHISLDDYHIVAVHPTTFGKAGYLAPDRVQYFRFGMHSAYFHGADTSAFAQMVDECRRGGYRPSDYRIFQFFPNLVLVIFEVARSWFLLIQQYVPLAHDRTLLRSWVRPAPFAAPDGGLAEKWLRRLTAPFWPMILPIYMGRVIREDNAVCERQQQMVSQIHGFPILSRHEERIQWFEEVYSRVMRGVL